MSSTEQTEQDHKIPLSRAELKPTHTYANVALTHLRCNRRKQNKTPTEYWAWLHAAGELDQHIFAPTGVTA